MRANTLLLVFFTASLATSCFGQSGYNDDEYDQAERLELAKERLREAVKGVEDLIKKFQAEGMQLPGFHEFVDMKKPDNREGNQKHLDDLDAAFASITAKFRPNENYSQETED